ncbi:U-box domain-containing protein 12-like [Prosopis cineraria]|uniref:U-box domain-containing protein 12-like n=1 Tax=Prosopis cineraria TaxID=364024 RepID=UPI00240ECC7D|nr:U-box domain-containing protein 12-like [Prosopis cineraria]
MVSSPSSSSFWTASSINLQFFTRIKRFLQSKSSRKRSHKSDQFRVSKLKSEISDQKNEKPQVEKIEMIKVTQKQSESIEEEEKEEEEEVECEILLQRSVKKLHFGDWDEKEIAAKDIETLAKRDVKARKLIMELGVVPVLVSMVASDVSSRRSSAVMALIQLADGSFTNKAMVVEAGILSKLPKRIDLVDESTRSQISELLLSLSSLATTQYPFSSLDLLPFLRDILQSNSSFDTKQSCLGAIFNLSAILENAGPLVSSGFIPILLELSSEKQLSERALASLGNLIVTLMGKKAIEESSMVPESLIEILSWEDKPKCQEISTYILMILAHQSSSQRQKMAKAGIVHVLLEVVLLGSTLAQKRASKLLQWFKDERQVRMGPHSGPQTSRTTFSMGSPLNQMEAREGKRMMKSLVKESLHRNMEIITERANIAAGESSLSSIL